MKKRILVTGGSGLIGSHLVEMLVYEGVSVTVIDNLSSGSSGNLDGVMNNIDFIEADVENFDFTNLKNISAVVHLAAQTSVPYSVENFYKSSSINLLSTIKIIEYCKTKHLPFVFASSSAVYGDLKYGDDTTKDVDPLSPYAIDKYMMEMYSKCAYQLYGFSSIGLRFFNVYGPRQDPSSQYSGVIAKFIHQLLNGLPVTINGGEQTRDFIYVEDVCNCILLSLNHVMKNKISDVINVSTGVSISINKLLSTLQNLIPNDSRLIYNKLPKGDPISSSGSTFNMNRILKINDMDMTNLVSGLKATISSFIESLSTNSSSI